MSKALLTAKKRPADLAAHLGVSRGLLTQWASGEVFPPSDKLIEISLWSGLSLGVLSGMAAEQRQGDAPTEGELEGRLRQLPQALQSTVLGVLANMEATAQALPREAFGPTVPNQVLEDHNWAAPESATAKRVAERRLNVSTITAKVKPK